MTRKQIKQALEVWPVVADLPFELSYVVDFALVCCAQQAEEDAKAVLETADSRTSYMLTAKLAEVIRANAPKP